MKKLKMSISTICWTTPAIRRWLQAMSAACMSLPAGLACAANTDGNVETASNTAAQTVPSTTNDEASIYAAFDRLREQGTLVKVPSIRDSVLRDAGGFRSALAKHGIGVTLISLNSSNYDLSSPVKTPPQRYNGQDLTGTSVQQLLVTYDLGQEGNDQSQLILGVTSVAVSWEPLGPRTKASLSRLAYYRTFNNRQWELKLGYLSNGLEYIGVYTGGSLASSAQGPSAVIPFQLGLARLPMAAPGLNLQYNGKNGFYNKLGLQRSTSPDGPQAEVDTHSAGFRFRTPQSNLLVINEVGVKRDATPSRQSVWLRAGAIFNNSNYKRFDESSRSNSNRALYVAADLQLTLPPNRVLPFQGWYAGASVNYAPQDRNLYSRYYEARAYKIGTFQNRPLDMLSMTYSHTKFSDDAADLYAVRGLLSESSTSAVTVSYLTRVHSGTYLSTGLSHISNPTFSPRMDDALNFMVGLNMFF
ncbi:carbohydrate porin [Stenotrophomonas sp. Iso1]|uniref:carbohydrate porin n=1 Tax=Stenotrophomonas sp. Iso1 TaxID=2977283 RepID=UPI0022B7C2AE|nr:carbohydrate porin [Stenotrophomonas sp. Iso1]